MILTEKPTAGQIDAGWKLQTATCVDGANQPISGLSFDITTGALSGLTVEAADDITCTFTNARDALESVITVKKVLRDDTVATPVEQPGEDWSFLSTLVGGTGVTLDPTSAKTTDAAGTTTPWTVTFPLLSSTTPLQITEQPTAAQTAAGWKLEDAYC